MTVNQRAPMSFPQHHIFFSHHHITSPQHPSHPILTFTVRNHTSATRHPENMSFKRKMVKAKEEEVLFQCLCCHKTNFRGKRNKLTKELKASSLLKHMKQKKSRSAEYECLRWYDEIKIGSGLQDYDFSSSLMQEYQDQTSTNVAQNGPTPQEKPPTSSGKRSYEDPSAGSFAGDDDASSLSDTENLGEFKEVVLPKSNSLTGTHVEENTKDNCDDEPPMKLNLSSYREYTPTIKCPSEPDHTGIDAYGRQHHSWTDENGQRRHLNRNSIAKPSASLTGSRGIQNHFNRLKMKPYIQALHL